MKYILLKLVIVLSMGFVMVANPLYGRREDFYVVNVQPGDTLYALSEKYLKDPKLWPEIYRYNRELIPDPHVILPEASIKIPVKYLKETISIAQPSKIFRDVRIKPQNRDLWSPLQANTILQTNDSIRTARRSCAEIKFDTGETLRIDENTLVTFEDREEIVRLRRGRIRSGKMKVITDSALIEPNKKTVPDFLTRIENNRETRVTVLSGEVFVSNQGREVTLKEGRELLIKYAEQPDENSIHVIEKELRGVDVRMVAFDDFHLQVASDMEFENIIYDRESNVDDAAENFWKKIRSVKYNDVTVGNIADLLEEAGMQSEEVMVEYLSEGAYYWRLLIVDYIGVEHVLPFGRFALKTTPPALTVNFAEKAIGKDNNMVLIRGAVEENGKVFVNGEKVSEVGKSFAVYLPLSEGDNRIQVQAVDAAENRHTQVHIVHLRKGTIHYMGTY